MSSKNLSGEASLVNVLPPLIINNPHERVLSDQISAKELEFPQKTELDSNNRLNGRLGHLLTPILQPVPLYPLVITWSPDVLCFQLEEKPIIARLWVWNLCGCSIYVHCCGLWNDTARIGASWCCYPRTRFLLAPGLKAEMFIKATPRPCVPAVPNALCTLQIAAQHMRDHVVGYFVVTMKVNFLKYLPPCIGECE